MKKYDDRAIIFIAVLFMFTSSFCMEVESPKESFLQLYQEINQKRDRDFEDFKKIVTDTNKKASILFVELQLGYHKLCVYKQQQDMFCTIREKYKIDEGVWNSYLEVASCVQKYKQQNAWQSTQVTHDLGVSKWFRRILKKQLDAVKIDPDQVNILHYYGDIPVKIDWPQLEWSYDKDKFYFPMSRPGTISVNKSLLYPNVPDVEEGRCIIAAYIMKSCETSDMHYILETFGFPLEQQDRNKFVDMSMMQAVFLAALKNVYNARCIKAYCSIVGPSFCSLDDYKNLASIEMYLKLRWWLKNL